jgi:ATP-dependent DNA ligase
MNLSDLKRRVETLGLKVVTDGAPAKEPFIAALKDHFLSKDYPDGPPFEEIQPMLCRSYGDLSQKEQDALWKDGNDWLAQEKLNGVRLILHCVKGVGVFGHGREINTKNFRRSEFHHHLLFHDFIPSFTATLDCEVVAGSLQSTVALLRMKPEESREKQSQTPLKIHVFDVTRWEGFDLRVRRLDERLAFIQDFRTAITAASMGQHFEFPAVHFQDKRGVFDRIIKAGGEGVVLKRLSSPYIDATSRSRTGWIKCKRGLEVTAYVSGFEPGRKGSLNENRVAVLHFSVNTENGPLLVAKISSLPNDLQKAVTQRDSATKTVGINPTFLGKVATISGVEIAYKSGRLTSARILHMRGDLLKEDCSYSASDLDAIRKGATDVVPMRIAGKGRVQ